MFQREQRFVDFSALWMYEQEQRNHAFDRFGPSGVRSHILAEGSIEIFKIVVARELPGKEFAAYR